MDKTTTITLDRTEYEINISEAKRLGIVKEIRPQITDFEEGDTFYWSHGRGREHLIILRSEYKKDKFIFSGIERTVCLFNSPCQSKAETIKYLNENHYIKDGNINQAVIGYLSSLDKKMVDRRNRIW